MKDVESLSKAEKKQKEIFICTFSMIAKMAGADGTVSKVEASAVDKFIKKVLKLDEDKRAFAIKIFNSARKSDDTFESFAERYKELLKDKPEMYEWMVDVLLRVSLADTVYTDSEADVLERACKAFSLPMDRYKKILAKYKSEDSSHHYEILESSPSDDADTIEQNYKQMLAKYDPQKIIDSGMPEEFVEVAKDKIEKIKEAYLLIQQERS